MQNYHLKVKQADHYQTLVRQAREYEEEEERKEMVGKKEVEKALQEKLAFARHCHQDLLGKWCQEYILLVVCCGCMFVCVCVSV